MYPIILVFKLKICGIFRAGAEECTDIPPPGSDLTCEQQAALGK